MYNSVTEEKIKKIPQIKGIDTSRLPQELTRIFSEIVSIRKSLSDRNQEEIKDIQNQVNTLKKLANNLETFVVGFPNHENKESAAFVAGIAHNLLWNIYKNILNRNRNISVDDLFHKDFISSDISAIILFMIGNSPADAAELANKFTYEEKKYNIKSVLLAFIKNLAEGKLISIVNTEIPNIDPNNFDNEEMAINILWKDLCYGIQTLAKKILNQKIDEEINFFEMVIGLSQMDIGNNELPFMQQSIFTGPYHLAKLLELLEGDLISRGITKVSPPENIDELKWETFTRDLAKIRPYLWENHLSSINNSSFLNPGNSAVLTFPTGAGKSTLSELKIASTLFNNKSVIYIVPTHALEDQTNENLRRLFPDFNISQNLGIDSEYTEIGLDKLAEINVMTPERCLSLIGVKPELFNEIGLIVFDEFHLIHGKYNSIERRNIDAMYCLLLLFNTLPSADFLLISAMVENGKEISDWISEITGRNCFSFNSSWKPTRQMQGCIIYEKNQIDALKAILVSEKLESNLIKANKKIESKLLVDPICLFSLVNMWDSNSLKDYHFVRSFSEQTNLSTGVSQRNGDWYLTPNKFEVAASLAFKFASMGLKTIVFVDTPKNTIGTAKKISQKLSSGNNNSNLYDKQKDHLSKLALELGNEKFAFLSEDGLVGVHHGNMLPIERMLCENLFKQKEGLRIIVATPTIAQGINLPAEVVIIAGDDRFNNATQNRESLEAYEILNTAGRAGRAGMSSQGVVIVIPAIITTIEKNEISDKWWKLKDQVFSKSDQCLAINDPLEYFLDSLQDETKILTEEHKAIIYRLNDKEDHNKIFFSKSLYYFRSRNKENFDLFEKIIQTVIKKKKDLFKEIIYPAWVLNVSTIMGLEPQIVNDMGEEIERFGVDNICSQSLNECIEILLNWMNADINRIKKLFSKTTSFENLLKILDIKKIDFEKNNSLPTFLNLRKLLISWITGETYEKINNEILGKDDKYCDKARLFILKIIPELSFVFGLFSMIIKEKITLLGKDPKNIPLTILTLSSCIREGVDSAQKLAFKFKNRHFSRIETHRKFEELNLDSIAINNFEELVNYF